MSLLAGPPGANAATWTTQTTPPPRAFNGSLSAISCGAGWCEATGTAVNDNGEQATLAEGWSASTKAWKTQPTPNPTASSEPYGNTVNELPALSCAASNACTAIEIDTTAVLFGTNTLHAERWNGTSWALQTIKLPSGEYGYLNGVSCPSTTACTAVGSYGPIGSDKQSPLILSWISGSGWAQQAAAAPPPGTTAFLNDVSCKAGGCVAVGASVNSSNVQSAFAELWNGKSWTASTPATVSGASSSVLNGISCSAAATCTAVGQYSASGGLGEQLSGNTWSAEGVSGVYTLSAVSCSASNACSAVGEFGPAIVRWNGTAWTSESAANTGVYTRLVGISCPVSSSCTAVGADGDGYGTGNTDFVPRSLRPRHAPAGAPLYLGSEGTTVAESWNGTAWTAQVSQDTFGDESASVQGVACTGSTSECVLVGAYFSVSAQETLPLSEVQSGSGWKIVTVPQPSTSPGGSLSGVSCSSQSSCVAVGSALYGIATVGLYSVWNGSAWKSGTVPVPFGGSSLSLVSVSCSSSSNCMAVGYYTDSSGQQAATSESWNGSAWTPHAIPNPSGATSATLDGVSCVLGVCQAAGSYYNGSQTIAMADRFAAGAWTEHTVPEPTGSTTGELGGVSCKTASSCTAVGTYYNGSEGALIERWTGSGWTLQTPASGWYGGYDISCPTTGACTATGGQNSSDWNGTTWGAPVSFAPTTDGGQVSIDSVSCTAAQACIAAGSSFHTDAALTPLVEGYA